MMSIFSRLVRTDPERYERLKTRLREALPVSKRFRESFVNKLAGLHQAYFEDFVFIHIPKCGGTSIERALGVPFLNHDTALEMQEKLGPRRWSRRIKFAAIRNPYARMASTFFYFRPKDAAEVEGRSVRFENWLVGWRDKDLEGLMPKTFKPQAWWLNDENGVNLMDFVCRIDAIQEEIKPVAAALGREIAVPRIKANPLSVDYDALYTPAARDIVKTLYAEDFERFGYDANR